MISIFDVCFNFLTQETSVITVHLIGAMMTFGAGTLLSLFDSFLTLAMHPEVNGRGIFWARLSIALLTLACYISGSSFVVIYIES